MFSLLLLWKNIRGPVKESGVSGKVATSAHLEACHMAPSVLFFWLSGSFLQLKRLLSFVLSGTKRIFPIVYFTFIVLFHILLNCKLNLWKTEVWQWPTLGISASKPHCALGCQGHGENLMESSGTPCEYDSFDLVEFQNLYFGVTSSTKRIKFQNNQCQGEKRDRKSSFWKIITENSINNIIALLEMSTI